MFFTQITSLDMIATCWTGWFPLLEKGAGSKIYKLWLVYAHRRPSQEGIQIPPSYIPVERTAFSAAGGALRGPH